MTKHQPQALDHGTPERRWHSPIVLEESPADPGRPGSFLRARNQADCLLDVMRDRGALGDEQDTTRRHAAGIDLRELHQAVHGQSVTMPLEMADRSNGEMSDQQARNHARLARIIRAAGPDWNTLRNVCCDDIPDPTGRICQALDKLSGGKKS